MADRAARTDGHAATGESGMVGYKLQNVLIGDDQRTRDYTDMYVRTFAPLLFSDTGSLLMPARSQYRFDTYFGGLSSKKWNRYTGASGFSLHIRACGTFQVRLTHFANDVEYNIASRNTCSTIDFDTEGETREVVCEYPDEVALGSDMLAFEIITSSDTEFASAHYEARVSEWSIRDVDINIITPTFKKEEFVRRNVELLEGLLSSDEPIADHLSVSIIDNGRTLGSDPLSVNSAIRKFDNPNFGGAGGFSRGMIEALHATPRPTHLLVMDDDVVVSPESLIRTYNLLRIVNDEYKNAFVSGAMISMQLQDRQIEDVGNIFDDGTFGAVKSHQHDLSDLDDVVSNESVRFNHHRQYAAFWYCCFPMSVVEEQGLCMPFFVRGDDAEFGLRDETGRRFMTMNGICVWHLSFGKSKFNPFNECYLAIRNALIIAAVNSNCESIGVYDELFLHDMETELRKFNYGYAEMMCDAVDDYLKGPSWIANADPEEILREKSAKRPEQVEFETLPPSVSRIHECPPLPIPDKVRMKLTHNGHVHCDDSKMSDAPGIMTNEYRLYHDSRIYMRKELWMVNDDLSTGYKTHIDRDRYKAIVERVKDIDRRYRAENDRVRREWKEAHDYLVSEAFWIDFLGLDPRDYAIEGDESAAPEERA